MSEKITKLAYKLKEGIDILLKYVETEYPSIYENLKDSHRFTYKIQYRFFIELTKKSWFKDNVKDIEVPVSSINIIPDKIETISMKKIFITDEILNLFEEAFPRPFKQIFTISDHYMISSRGIHSEELFYHAFYEIFLEYINKDLEAEVILNSLIKDWNGFLNQRTMPIELRISLRQIVFSDDLPADGYFKLVHINDYLIESKDSFSFPSFSGLSYTTSIKVGLFETEKDIDGKTYQENYNDQLQQYRKIHHEVKKFLTCIYLKGYEISDYIPQIKYPWWSPYKYESFFDRNEDSYYTPRDWPKKMETWDFKNILTFYENLKKNDFFHAKCFPITRSLMELALSRKNDIDRVFDAHIFLEFLFGPGDQGELSFRVSMNASLFISKNFTEFEKNFYFFRALYDIRSAAIHGGDWLGRSIKMLTKLKNNGWEFSNVSQMFGMIENIIRIIIEKLITLNINLVQFRNQINNDALFFIRMAKYINKSNELKS